MDLIEIAIQQFTDADNFEKIACEILYNEGFYDVKPMPGGSDFGQDAIEDKFYENIDNSKRTIFQISLQEKNIKGKIQKTITRIKESNIEFEELIYVTNREITATTQQNLKTHFRKEAKVKIDFYEENTFINRLANLDNGIFNRHFPNIDKQIHSLKNSKPTFSDDYSKSIETAILKSTLAFTFNNDISKTRKSVFDNLILGLLYEKESSSLNDLLKHYNDNIDKNFNNSQQIRSSIERLSKEKFITLKNSNYSINKKGKLFIESINYKVNLKTEKLLDDIVLLVCENYKSTLSQQEKLRVKKNSKEIFIEIFKLFGIEIANKLLDDNLSNSFEIQNRDFLINKAKNNLPEGIAEILISVIAEILRNPTAEQALILSSWTKAFIGTKIMNIDPSLNEFSELTFSKKKFFLDTDFLLNTIVQELPNSIIYRNLIKRLVSFGTKVYIEKGVLAETMKHAQISMRTYNYFGKSIDSLSDTLADNTIFNTFVLGYYYSRKSSNASYENYLSNYYDENLGEEYFLSVIYDSIPIEVEIIDIESLEVAIPEDLNNKYKGAMQKRLDLSRKAKYRNEEETAKLIDNDATLFLTCYIKNGIDNKKNVVFGGNYYLITNSLKYLKAASEIKIKDSVTTKPLILEGIFELTGKSNLTDKEYVKLIDNSLLMYAIEGCIDDILFIVKSGIKLNDKSLPRLKADYNEVIHKNISEFERIRTMSEKDRSEIPDFEDYELRSFNEFITKMKAAGYSTIPQVDYFITVIENKDKENLNLKENLEKTQKEFEILTEELEKFGKRRQNYLNKIKGKE